ncbi:cytosine deaminase-like metal-dependent hydrolase [Synechococcus sp. PCC 7502]|uniref:cytosine deaminase n=1 Tax=Synechococcus sp. PCC 7502 TaxID=1173263 RepID=UPI00029FBCE3|nr:cytosine deaminase [Synechococcus sp. PCC 7502]AFY74400.1 cytosine deaminase-like metal-dependent hydrolase [Synechococcus sp. PCC 7502]
MVISSHYWLINAHIPQCLLRPIPSTQQHITKEGLVCCDLEIRAGKIIAIYPSELTPVIDNSVLSWDLKKGIVLPCFVDMHTHLDKGHIWERTPNPDGTFESALRAVAGDRSNSYDDLYRRMEFGLKSSYAQGTKAIRTHLDCPWDYFDLTLQVFKDLQTKWSDRLILQPVSLITLGEYAGKRGEVIADRIAELGGVVGGVPFTDPNLEHQLDRLFSLAKDRNLDLDLHTDENDDPTSQTLKATAEAALRHQFKGSIVCDHCCSLAVQRDEDVNITLELLKAAKIGIVSLPMCNLYLQDRHALKTPRWRGITLIHELKQAEIPIAIASDNVRDPFFGFGNHDGLEVFSMAVKIAHLDTPYGDWIKAITTTPAALMGLESNYISVGASADLVIFKARYFSELLSRPQSDRHVLRKGIAIDTALPDYADLD